MLIPCWVQLSLFPNYIYLRGIGKFHCWRVLEKCLPSSPLLVLERLLEANLMVNLAKCEFAKATVMLFTVNYLYNAVGQGQVLSVHAKVTAIQKYPGHTT